MFELKRRSVDQPSADQAGGDRQPVVYAYPALASMLTSERWPDGSVRVPSSVTLFWHDGALKACLNDKDADLTAWVSAASLEGLLEALEAGLQGDCLDWRKGGKRPSKKR